MIPFNTTGRRITLCALFLAVTIGAVRADDEPTNPELTDEEIFAAEREKLRASRPEFFALFTEVSMSYSGGGYQDEPFKYQLFAPELEEGQSYPLIVWLHGAGEAGGENNIDQLLWWNNFVFRPPYEKRDYPFFMLAVQCSEVNRGWTTSNPEQDDMLNVVMAAIEKTIADYPVDLNRISLAGISSGGTACWTFALRHPNLFSAVAPMSSTLQERELTALASTPIWVFHSKRDTIFPYEEIEKSVSRARNAGASVRLTFVNEFNDPESAKHNSWGPAFRDHNLLAWLISQRKDQSSATTSWNWLRHNYLNWAYLWPRLTPVLIVALLVVAIRREIVRRRNHHVSQIPEPAVVSTSQD